VATLSVEYADRPLDGGGAARLVILRGSVDSSTVEQLDSNLAQLLDSERCLAVLECSDLEYVNSRGMSILIKHHDAVKASGGAIVLAGVPNKIVATFELMGLNATFAFAEDEPAALAQLAAGPSAVTPAGEPASAGQFPMAFSCDSCAASLNAASPGKYRCPRCQSCFEVTGGGEIMLFPVRSAQTVELSLPCNAKYSEVARSAAAAVAKDLELSSIAAELFDRAVDEAVGLYAGKAADGGRVRMFLAADNREFTVAFLTTDPNLEITDDDQQGLTLRTLKGFVDQVDIVSLSPEGQVLKLVKQMGE
jgi:anti-anti-sigma factor